jgi:hypothetical protein
MKLHPGGLRMDETTKKKIEGIIDGMSCPKDFICAEKGFEALCKVRKIGLDSYLECLEEKPWDCRFGISFGDSYFCSCPLRVYLAEHIDD